MIALSETTEALFEDLLNLGDSEERVFDAIRLASIVVSIDKFVR
jgi:hypothetical protein